MNLFCINSQITPLQFYPHPFNFQHGGTLIHNGRLPGARHGHMRHARKSARVPTHARSMSPAHLPHTKSTHDRTNSWGPAQAPNPRPRASMPIQRDPGRKCEPNGDREVKDVKDDREIRAGPCGQRASERAKYSPRSKLRLLRKGRHDEPHRAQLIGHEKN